MQALMLVTCILAIVSGLSMIWLTVRAFLKNIVWGLAVLLFSPVSATLFGLRYWQEEKNPFLIYITTTSTSIGLSLYLFTVWGGWELLESAQRVQQGIAAQNLSQEDASAFIKANLTFVEKSGLQIQDPQILELLQQQVSDPVAEPPPEEPDTQAADEPPPAPTSTRDLWGLAGEARPPAARYRLEYQQIDKSEAGAHIGSTVLVTRRNALEKEYRLTGVNRHSMQFMQRNRHGSFSFSLNNRDIEKIRVLTKQPY